MRTLAVCAVARIHPILFQSNLLFRRINIWYCRGPKGIQKTAILDIVFMHYSRDKNKGTINNPKWYVLSASREKYCVQLNPLDLLTHSLCPDIRVLALSLLSIHKTLIPALLQTKRLCTSSTQGERIKSAQHERRQHWSF